MPRSSRSSSSCATCRFEWKPSRWLLAALMLLPLLAALSLIASSLPRAIAWPLAAVVLALGAWRWRHEARQPLREILLKGVAGDAHDGAGAGGEGSASLHVEIDGVEVEGWQLHWRGPLAFASFRLHGRREYLSWWPDTLPASQRRELRLAAARAPAPSKPAAAAKTRAAMRQ